AYQATFRICHLIDINPGESYPGVQSDYANRGMHILEIALHAFFDDTQQLVSDGVQANIEALISAADSEDTRKAAVKHGKHRKNSLKHWLALDMPLAYGQNDSNETYQALVQAVVSDASNITNGLPNMDQNSMAPMEFVNLILKMSSPSSPSAPVLGNGSFLPIIKEAHRSLLDLAQEQDPVAQHSFISKLLLCSIQHLHIHFVPFHLPNVNRPGAPYRKPVYNSWANLGLKDTTRALPTYQAHPQPSSSQHAAGIALSTALANDSNAEWFEGQLTLANLHSILHKSHLPGDFKTPTLSGVKYVDDTYSWVREAYDATRPLHHLALIVAIIASHLVPKLFLPKNVNKEFFRGANPQQVHQIYCGIQWESRPKKGMTEKSIFVAMFTTFIIALYEPGSPLRQYMLASGKGGLGDSWTQKHTVKGLSYTTFIRLGIIWGSGPGAYDKGSFNKHWGCHPPHYISALYESLLQTLTRPKDHFGPYDALSILIGHQNADKFCKSHLSFPSRGPTPGPSSSVSVGDAV
ncbi:hypothetical protein V8E53_014098, partial [Lactarius tabidus]